MFASNAFQNPFADFDSRKYVGNFNILAVAQRPGDMMRAVMEDFSKHGSEMLAAASIEERAAKQIDFAKKSYEAAIANTKELTDLYVKGQAEALVTINERITALSDEVKAAIAKK
jgi:phasin family protein